METEVKYPNAGPNADLARYRTGEVPAKKDIVSWHGEPVNDGEDVPPVLGNREAAAVGLGCVVIPDDDGDLIAVRAARFDLISRAPVEPAAEVGEGIEQVRQELQMVLNDWNDLVKASGARANGTAIGHVASLVRSHSELLELCVDGAKRLELWIEQSCPEDRVKDEESRLDSIHSAIHRAAKITGVKNPCERCGTQIYSGPPDCPRCGAPNCCPKCCEESEADIAPSPSPEPSARAAEVDLELALPGDKCHLRNGRVEVFDGPAPEGWSCREYCPYRVQSGHTYRRDGGYTTCAGERTEWDIVRVVRDGVQITLAVEKCCLCDSPMGGDGHCTGDHDGCVMTAPSASPCVIQGAGKYRTVLFDKTGSPHDLAEIVGKMTLVASEGLHWVGVIGGTSTAFFGDDGECSGPGQWTITGPYVPQPKPEITLAGLTELLKDAPEKLETLALWNDRIYPTLRKADGSPLANDGDEVQRDLRQFAFAIRHLVAVCHSAPDLLEACRQLVAAMHQLGKGHHREVSFAEAAIAQVNASAAE
jgi:hypothetical protein